MTRRITRTMVAVVAGALLLTTVGTVVLLRLETRAEARSELRQEAERIALRLETFQREGVLPALVTARALEGATILRVMPGTGRLIGPLPDGLTAADLDIERLVGGDTQAGTTGSLVFAAAGAVRGQGVFVVVLTRRVATGVPGAAWIAMVAAAALALTAGVATDLGRRLTRPIRQAQAATHAIAGGDLAVRVPVVEGDGELADLARSINAMAASLDRSRDRERQFLLSVSHDLRTPLTSIRGYADALADGRDPDPAHAAGVIQSEARRLERLVTDLLELARLGARRFSLHPTTVDVGEVVAGVAEGFRPAATEAGVELTVATAGAQAAGPRAAADPDRLAQIVANLVENALRFARASISITAAGVEAGGAGHVLVTVEDDGPGIDPDDAGRVFEPFYQGVRTPARTVGTGLGLAIARELAEAMGGSVAASGRPGGGARVEVRVPAAGGPDTAQPATHPDAGGAAHGGSPSG